MTPTLFAARDALPPRGGREFAGIHVLVSPS